MDRDRLAALARRALPRPALLAALVVLLLAVARASPPDAPPEEPPADQFSARRAYAHLGELLRDGEPHPVGSAANERVRGRLVAALRAIGLAPEVQRARGTTELGRFAEVHNVIARVPGREGGRAVLLASHHDSTWAGPGACDDGAGVAAMIEVARALRHGPQLRNDVILLFTDGEEPGQIGARAFQEEHPSAREVRVVVNLEARGTSGWSLLFEAGPRSAWLVERALRAAPRPRASSVLTAIYARLDHWTDLAALTAGGAPGLGFAFAGGARRYHTPLDDLRSVDLASLSHHGQQALAVVRALGDEDLERVPEGEAVFFDVLGAFVVAWPRAAALPLSLAAALLVVGGILGRLRRGELSTSALARSTAAAALAALAALLGGAALVALVLLRHGDAHRAPPPTSIAPWALAALAAHLSRRALVRRAGAVPAWPGVSALWSAGAVAVSIALPDASHLFAVPALGAAVSLWITAVRPCPPAELRGAALPAAAAALVWVPLALLAMEALGLHGIPVAALAASLVLITARSDTAAAPCRRGGRVAAVVLALSAGAVLLWPPFSAARPRFAYLVAHEEIPARAEERGAAELIVASGEVPPSLIASAGLRPRDPPVWDRYRERVHATAIPALGLPPPELFATGRPDDTSGRRAVRARLRSQRGARILRLLVPEAAGLDEVAVEGIAFPRAAVSRTLHRGYHQLIFEGVPEEGVDIELVVRRAGPIDVLVADQTLDLPAAVGGWLARMPDELVVSTLTVVLRSAQL